MSGPDTPDGRPALELSGLSVRYPGATSPAVQDASLSLRAGETLALLGPSGCGKSTLLRAVAGLERPLGGRVLIGGVDRTGAPPERRNVGLVFQDYALFPHLSVLDNAAYGPRQRGLGRAAARERGAQALSLVGLAALGARRPDQLSGGQQQRVALARALAAQSSQAAPSAQTAPSPQTAPSSQTAQPALLLLDEPLSNLDEQLRAELRGELRALFARLGAAVLLVTHDQREALALAGQVALMRAGRIVQQGPTGEVFARPRTAWVAAFLGHANLWPQAGGVRLVPETAARLWPPESGEGEPLAVEALVPGLSGATLRLRHPAGPLQLTLSARELGLLGAGPDGQTLRVSLDPDRCPLLPDDREPDGRGGA